VKGRQIRRSIIFINVFLEFVCNLSTLLRDHETGSAHILALCDWLEFERRLKLQETIDKQLQIQIDAEKLRWRAVLERLLTVVNFLAGS